MVVDHRLLLYLLAATIMLVIDVKAFHVFLKRHSGYNLATAIVITLILTGIILGYFYPDKLDPLLANAGTTARILIAILFVFLLEIFLFYPEIKRLINQRRKRK